MATHSGVLAWRIPGMGEPRRLPSMVSQSRTLLKGLSTTARVHRVAKGQTQLNSGIDYFTLQHKETMSAEEKHFILKTV